MNIQQCPHRYFDWVRPPVCGTGTSGFGMKSIKYLIITSCVAGIALIPLAVPQAAPEFNKVRQPTREQIQTMLLLNRQISDVQRDIGRFFEDLRDHTCEDDAGGEKIFCEYYKIDENGISLIPLMATKETFYGVRQRYILNESAAIYWKDEKPDFFRFDTRRGALGKGAVLIKRLSGNSIAPPPATEGQAEQPAPETQGQDAQNAATPLNLIVNELLSSGKGQFVNFRFPDGAEARDFVEKSDVDGTEKQINVVFVRDANQQIRIMRDYFKKLRLLDHRLDWMARAKDARKAAEIERLLRQ